MEISSVNLAQAVQPVLQRSVVSDKVITEISKSSDLTDLQKEIKDQAVTLKSDNDLFGALKTVEKSLIALRAIATSAQNGELDSDEAVVAINERMEATRYKNENLYANFPLADGSTLDIREKLQVSSPSEIAGFANAVEVAIKDSSKTLAEVKERIMGGANAMGASAQKSYERSGLNTINPSGIVANTNVDYLKEQFSKLMKA